PPGHRRRPGSPALSGVARPQAGGTGDGARAAAVQRAHHAAGARSGASDRPRAGRVRALQPESPGMSVTVPPAEELPGWRYPRAHPSLPESNATILVPRAPGGWRKALAFAGPGYLVAVGYMDPGNWATDLAGGARFGYALLSVILVSNLMAILLQALALRLGIASGRDLAQACRDTYSKPTTIVLWVLCEIAIAACDLAEVIGAAIALNLLFGLPLMWGVCLTALVVLLVL